MGEAVKMKLTPPAQPTASELVVAKAAESFDVEDARGRTITIRKPGVLAQFKLIEVLGETASNQTYVSMVIPLIYVSAIDGNPIVPMTRKSEVEALIQRLDEDGLNAVMKGVTEHFNQTSLEEDRAALKK